MSVKTLLLSIAFALVPAVVAAQEAPPADGYEREGTMGAGLQLTWPTYGFSFMFDLSDRLSAQAVVGPAYGLGLAGRGLYRLSPQELFIPYGYGEVGMWTGYFGSSVVYFGGGGGVEADPRRILEDLEELPPIYVSLELGILIGQFTGINAGTALHYRF